MNKKTGSAIGVLYLITEAASLYAILYIMRTHFSLNEAVTWLFLSSLLPIASLVVSGYGPLITREIAKLSTNYGAEQKISIFLITSTTGLLKKSILFIAGLAIFIATYNWLNNGFRSAIVILIFFLAIVSRAYMNWVFAYLAGLRKYGVDKATMLTCSIASFILVYLSAKSGGNLIYIVIIYATPYICCAVIMRHAFKTIKMKYGGEFSRVDAITAKEIFKMYLINFAGFLTLNTDLYIAKNNFDEITFVELGVLSRVALGIVSVTAVIVAIQTPSYSSLHAMGNYERLLYNVGFTSKIISALVIFFGVAFIFTYEPLVKFITLNQPALGTHIVATWMVFAVLVVNIMNIGAAIISTGDSDLVRIALPASVIGFVGAIVGASSLGPVGMIIGMIIGGTLSLVSHLKLLKNILRN